MPAPRSWSQRLRPGPRLAHRARAAGSLQPGLAWAWGHGWERVTGHILHVCLGVALFPAHRSGLGNFLLALQVQHWPQLVRSWVNLEACSLC